MLLAKRKLRLDPSWQLDRAKFKSSPTKPTLLGVWAIYDPNLAIGSRGGLM